MRFSCKYLVIFIASFTMVEIDFGVHVYANTLKVTFAVSVQGACA